MSTTEELLLKRVLKDEEDLKSGGKTVQKGENQLGTQQIRSPCHKPENLTVNESDKKFVNRGGFKKGNGQSDFPIPDDPSIRRGLNPNMTKPAHFRSRGFQQSHQGSPQRQNFPNSRNDGNFHNSPNFRNSESFAMPGNSRFQRGNITWKNQRDYSNQKSHSRSNPATPRYEILSKPKLVALDSVESFFDEAENRYIYPENFKVICQAKIKGWMIIFEKSLADVARKFVILLKKDATKRGLKLRLPTMNPVETTKLEMVEWKNMFRKLKMDYDLIMILDSHRDNSHNNIKIADSLCPGIRTQHVMLHSVERMLEADNADSLIWKFNYGCNGFNYKVLLDDVA